MVRASWVLNLHWMVARAALRSLTRAWTSRRSASSWGSRCFKQERDSTLNSISAIPSTSSGQDSTSFRAWRCSGTPAAWQFAGPPDLGTSRTGMPDGEWSGCPARPTQGGPFTSGRRSRQDGCSTGTAFLYSNTGSGQCPAAVTRGHGLEFTLNLTSSAHPSSTTSGTRCWKRATPPYSALRVNG